MGINGRYVRIATKFWADEKVVDLDPETKLLYLYILSCPHSNMAGYYRLPKPYIQADLKLSDKGLTKGFNKLLSKGLIKYCEKSSVIFIPNYYKYNSIQNKNQAKGAANRTSELPKNSLVKDYKIAIKQYAESYYKELCKGLPKGFDEGLPKQSGNTELELESELDTDIEKDSSSDKSDKDKFSITKLDNGRYDYPDEYEEIYAVYPDNKGTKKAGWRKWAARRRENVPQEKLMKAAENYAHECKKEKRSKKYVKHIQTFFGPDEHWKQYLTIKEDEPNGKQVSKDNGRKEKEPEPEESIFNV